MKKISFIFSFLLCFVLFFSISTYASELEFPEIPKPDDYPYQHYIIYKDTAGKTGMYIMTLPDDTPITSYIYNKVSGKLDLTFRGKKGMRFYFYELNNNSWKSTGSVTNGNSDNWTVSVSSDSGIYYSTFNIYDSDQTTLFFQQTPIPQEEITVQMMVAEEVPKMAEKVIQTMKIILLCGVGCLALLMALPVLSKVFYRFRLR